MKNLLLLVAPLLRALFASAAAKRAAGFRPRTLNRDPDVWFKNFGTGGYSTGQAMMRAGRAYDQFYAARFDALPRPKLEAPL